MTKETPKSSPQTEQKATGPIVHTRGDNFIERYANNIFFEGSAWDLKLIFGNLDQSLGPNHVTQHSALTVPWAQVKLLSYYLRFHLLAHEARMGRVQILPGIITPIPPAPPSDLKTLMGTDDLEVYQKARKLYEEFIAANPEAVSSVTTTSGPTGKQ